MISQPTTTQLPQGELNAWQLLDYAHQALAMGQLNLAHDAYWALRDHPQLSASALNGLGVIAGQGGAPTQAIAIFREAVQRDPNHAEALHNLCLAYETTGQKAEAAHAWNAMGVALHQQRRLTEAAAAFRRLLERNPRDTAAAINLGAVLDDLGLFEEALPLLEAALMHIGDDLSARALALNNLGNCLSHVGRWEEAERVIVESIRIGIVQALVAKFRWNLSHLYLLLGRYEEGWALWESRSEMPDRLSPDRGFPQPAWKGEPINGRTVLLYTEQGFGDTIQFAPLVHRLAAMDARVIFEVQPELFRLMRLAFTDSPVTVISRMDDPRLVQGNPSFDLHCSQLSLPHRFNLGEADLPLPALLPAPATLPTAEWLDRVGAAGSELRAGVVWAGRPEHKHDYKRSMPLDLLAPLLSLTGIRWFSLQLGPARDEVTRYPGITDLAQHLHDFVDTA